MTQAEIVMLLRIEAFLFFKEGENDWSKKTRSGLWTLRMSCLLCKRNNSLFEKKKENKVDSLINHVNTAYIHFYFLNSTKTYT